MRKYSIQLQKKGDENIKHTTWAPLSETSGVITTGLPRRVSGPASTRPQGYWPTGQPRKWTPSHREWAGTTWGMTTKSAPRIWRGFATITGRSGGTNATRSGRTWVLGGKSFFDTLNCFYGVLSSFIPTHHCVSTATFNLFALLLFFPMIRDFFNFVGDKVNCKSINFTT